MGQMVAKLSAQCTEGLSILLPQNRKRRCTSSSSEDDKDETQDLGTTGPKKKKLLTTTQYIYQALFKDEKNSDVAVMVLGKIWNLHKIYLCQSPYFYSMFNGSWREACEPFVHIQIEDERINVDALDAVFGSLYSDEIDINSKNAISILATATLFHMESIIERCTEVMVENINRETAIDYYECACQYGCMDLKKKTFEWLETNLLHVYSKYRKPLQQISMELMSSLVSSPELFVMQTEFSLYALLRTWTYLRLHPDYDPEQQTNNQATQNNSENINDNGQVDVIRAYFVNRNEKCSFLATSEGQQYMRPFQLLRTQYLATHHMDLKIVLADNIIPKEWIQSHVLSHWSAILKVDHLPEEGPQNLDASVFFANCMRCARSLPEPGYQKWRWTGFNFGLDLILILDSRLLRIRRHHRNEHERLLSLQTQRQFMIRVSVASLNSQRQPVMIQKSDILSLCLEKNEEATLMILDPKLVHPLLISLNLLVVPPSVQTFKEQILIPPSESAINITLPISEIGANSIQNPEEQNVPLTTTSSQRSSSNRDSSSINVCDVSSSPTSSATHHSVATNTDATLPLSRQFIPASMARPCISSSSVISSDNSDAFI